MPMFMLNGNQYGGNGGNYQVARMSKADYDALTDAQKNDGTLRIVVDSAGNSVNYMSAQVAGAKTDDTLTNLLNPTFGTTTKNGVTCTDNGDGTYTLTGTASAYTNFMIIPYTKGEKVKKGQYKLVGCPEGGGAQIYKIWICESSHGSDIDNQASEYGDGVICNFDGAKSIHVEIQLYNGVALPNDGITFKPMLTPDLQATYDDFVGYTGGTGRLNSDVAEHQKEISRINSDLSDISNEVNLKGERNVIGIISKVYYGSYQALVFLPKAKDFNITVTDLYAGVGNSDVHITNFSTSKYDNGVRITFTSSTDVSGCLATATFTIS